MSDAAVLAVTVADRPAAAPAEPLRLRVLSGRLAGAEHRLPRGRSVTLGHSFENDVVLRGAGTAGLSAEIHVGDDATLLRVLTGSVVALGREVAAGEELLLPGYLPVRLGEFAFAVGADDPGRWDEAVELAGSVARPIEGDARRSPRAAMRERVLARTDGWRKAGRRRIRALVAGGAALVVLGAAVPAWNYWSDRQARDPAHVRRELAAAGLPGLVVRPDPGGAGVLITGGVTGDREMERLNALVAERFPGALVEVETASSMAAAASDMLRAQGVEAEVTAVRPGVIAVATHYLPADRRRELAELLRRDMPALALVEYRTASGGGSDELRHFFNSPQFGAASFVDGDPGFIVTGDGSRWFAGAVLPTGHRLVSIGRGRATLERGGQVEVLAM